ncbi:DUF1254 domain-containing protein [Rhizobium paknamense]|uniref:Membrane protein n=1 Tax=Rhizobium paknamense TaxID=1206817 RepID=A0ABU0I7U7_9HYPH|nr:DUF1254 domain-containing protein [Rhizobium paknamense]MDQ0454303.1 putative membrane protein [Rhizobium paknamense]
MRKLIYALLVGLIGALVLHIVIILALPRFTGKDAYTRVTREGPSPRFYSLAKKPDGTGLAQTDPYLRQAVCAFDVTQAPIRLTAQGSVPFWSIGLFDKAANEVYSMTDATAVEGRLDIIAGTAAQLSALRNAEPDLVARTVLVEMPQAEGYAVLRALAPQPSALADAQDFLSRATCSALKT